ncbi:unnamed protein product [Auanema sp. JU1783]|nr:unnamed protein product [Auanema sp. JU1783]
MGGASDIEEETVVVVAVLLGAIAVFRHPSDNIIEDVGGAVSGAIMTINTSRYSPIFVVFTGLLLSSAPAESSAWIYEAVDESELIEARHIGQQAKNEYLDKIQGLTDQKIKSNYYLDGLEKCNEINKNFTVEIESTVLRNAHAENSLWLQKAGVKQFIALFMTLPNNLMQTVSHQACLKHEKQLECGSEFEGHEMTLKRIEDLKTIGNHRLMFEKECSSTSFVTSVYPCIGNDVATWMKPCASLVNSYATMREHINEQIETIYDNAVQTIKRLPEDEKSSGKPLFHKTMKQITQLEGIKCEKFKMMRLCTMRRLLNKCGTEAVRAYNTSISVGYLRTERRERLNLDFEVFNYPTHINCAGL